MAAHLLVKQNGCVLLHTLSECCGCFIFGFRWHPPAASCSLVFKNLSNWLPFGANSSLFCCQTELHFISAFSEVILPWACLQPARKLPQNVASGIVMHFRKSFANSHVLCGLQIFNSKSSHLQFRVAGLIYFGESRLSFLLNFGWPHWISPLVVSFL